VTYIGELGSGNYVKMVHNGIEYGDMQLIAESYDLLRSVGGLTNAELAEVFATWNAGELDSFLIEITARIFSVKDKVGGGDGHAIDAILDKTGMKGTGRWTIQEAAERCVAAPTMAAALDARFLSGIKEERVAAAKVLVGPTELPRVDKAQLIADVRAALYAAKICSYAQGMNLIREAGRALGWRIDLGECARIWKGGCIIRAKVSCRGCPFPSLPTRTCARIARAHAHVRLLHHAEGGLEVHVTDLERREVHLAEDDAGADALGRAAEPLVDEAHDADSNQDRPGYQASLLSGRVQLAPNPTKRARL
jgi:hypothetical protein